MAGKRIDRISSEYKQAMAQCLRSLKDPRVQGLVSITRCDVTNDLRYARIHISVYGDEAAGKKAVQGLRSASGYLRREAAQKVGLRAAPEPIFLLDDSITYGADILSVLNKLEQQPPAPAITVKYTLDDACSLIERSDNFLILTHIRPDGDTLGSASALCRALRYAGKTAYVLRNPEATEKYDFLFDSLIADESYVPETVIAVDTASASMLPKCADAYKNRVDLLIDHHASSSLYSRALYCEPEAAAVGELILKVIDKLELTLDRDMAEGIYCAVLTDTGCFRFSNTTDQTFEVARRCHIAGADLFALNLKLFMVKSRSRVAVETYVMNNIQFETGGHIAYCSIKNSVITSLGVTPDDLDDISSILRYIEGVDISIVLTEYDYGIKVSVRTAPGYDAGAICRKFDGGGHAAAAGCTVKDDIDNVCRDLIAAAADELNK